MGTLAGLEGVLIQVYRVYHWRYLHVLLYWYILVFFLLEDVLGSLGGYSAMLFHAWSTFVCPHGERHQETLPLYIHSYCTQSILEHYNGILIFLSAFVCFATFPVVWGEICQSAGGAAFWRWWVFQNHPQLGPSTDCPQFENLTLLPLHITKWETPGNLWLPFVSRCTIDKCDKKISRNKIK